MTGNPMRRALVLAVSAAFLVVALPAPATATDYSITVKTADEYRAGTDNTVKVKLHGSLGNSNWLALDKKGVDDHERGDERTYSTSGRFGRIFKTEVQLTKDILGDGWVLEYIEIQSGKGDSEFDFDNMEIGPGKKDSKYADGFGTDAWVQDHPEEDFNQGLKSVIKAYNNLYSREPVYRKKTFKRRIRHQVQASNRVTESTMIGVGMGWKSPTTAAGSFSAEFKSEWSTEVEKAKAQLDEEELQLIEVIRFRVPKKTLWLSRVVWRSRWGTGMLEAGVPLGVRWLTEEPQAIKEENATLRFGDWVPKEWRAYIRKDYPQYVPPRLRNKTGPFRLSRP